MDVGMGGQVVSMHCPTTGRIGDIDVAGRPCLVSPSHDPKRKTKGTVEAVSLDRSEDAQKSWIGIDQNAANRYVEHYLKSGAFADIIGACEPGRCNARSSWATPSSTSSPGAPTWR